MAKTTKPADRPAEAAEFELLSLSRVPGSRSLYDIRILTPEGELRECPISRTTIEGSAQALSGIPADDYQAAARRWRFLLSCFPARQASLEALQAFAALAGVDLGDGCHDRATAWERLFGVTNVTSDEPDLSRVAAVTMAPGADSRPALETAALRRADPTAGDEEGGREPGGRRQE